MLLNPCISEIAVSKSAVRNHVWNQGARKWPLSESFFLVEAAEGGAADAQLYRGKFPPAGGAAQLPKPQQGNHSNLPSPKHITLT